MGKNSNMPISTKGRHARTRFSTPLIWCTNSVRRFLRDLQSDVLKHPIVSDVINYNYNNELLVFPQTHTIGYFSEEVRAMVR